MAKYNRVFVFTKKGNLLPWFHSKNLNMTQASAEYYGKERDIELIAMFRYEITQLGTKCFCKIKCPVKPLPVKGEFEAPSESSVINFLSKEGWHLKQKIYPHMFE